LLNSNATFKFIVIGSQIFNTANVHESYLKFPEERDDLLNFITENKIEGVIFLTGDRHVSAVHTFERENDYTLYDFTSSALLSPGGKIVGIMEKNNPSRLEGSMITKKNYAVLEFSGAEKNRILDVLYYDKRGKLLREYQLHENDLK
jgi:alkaline phosphatase D